MFKKTREIHVVMNDLLGGDIVMKMSALWTTRGDGLFKSSIYCERSEARTMDPMFCCERTPLRWRCQRSEARTRDPLGWLWKPLRCWWRCRRSEARTRDPLL